MDFMTAKAELKKLANGKYHTVQYELVEFASGRLEAECELYVDSRILSSGPTWEEALNKMKVKLGLIESKVGLSEAPGEEGNKNGGPHPCD